MDEANYKILSFRQTKKFILGELAKKFPNTEFRILRDKDSEYSGCVFYHDGPSEKVVKDFLERFFWEHEKYVYKILTGKTDILFPCDIGNCIDSRLFTKEGVEEFKKTLSKKYKNFESILTDYFEIRESLFFEDKFRIQVIWKYTETITKTIRDLIRFLNEFSCKKTIINTLDYEK
jgi:hypothetical protein